jgi:hypothetical protein
MPPAGRAPEFIVLIGVAAEQDSGSPGARSSTGQVPDSHGVRTLLVDLDRRTDFTEPQAYYSQ